MEPEKGSKAGQVLEALRAIGRGGTGDVAKVAEMPRDLASAHLCNLRKRGLVERSGERGNYTWWPIDG